jgi:hypothetical protein
MSQHERQTASPRARAIADERRHAMRRRARRIRRSVTGLALALFLSAFLVVYTQLATGHDPALTANAARRSAASSTIQKPTTSSGGGASGSDTSTSTTASAEREESSASAVTTSQS